MNLRRALIALVTACVLAGCGDDSEPSGNAATDRPTATESGSEPVTMKDVRGALEDAGVMTMVTGLGSVLNEEIPQPALSAARYEIPPSSREFELLVFGDVSTARDAVSDLAKTEMVENGGAIARGQNVVAVFPEQPSEFRGYRVVERVLARLPARP